MREIAAATITEAIRDMCIEANYGLAPDLKKQWRRRSPLWAARFWASLRRT